MGNEKKKTEKHCVDLTIFQLPFLVLAFLVGIQEGKERVGFSNQHLQIKVATINLSTCEHWVKQE